PGRRPGALAPGLDRAGPLRDRHRRRGDRRVRPAVEDGGHHPGARAGSRAGVGVAGARRARWALRPGQSVRPRRQGRRADDGHPGLTGGAPVDPRDDLDPRIPAAPAEPGPLERALRERRDQGRKLLVPYVTGGLGAEWLDVVAAIADAGADAIEI